MLYKRLTIGLADKGKIVQKGQEYTVVKNLINNKDIYVSMFDLNQKQAEEFNQKHSIAGILDVKTNQVLFDIDCKSSLEKALKDTREVVKRLLDNGVKNTAIRIFFSGNKGFHVVIEFTREFSPNEVKSIVHGLAKGIDTIDMQIYNASRVVRLPLTKHQESGLYKIPLTIEQLMDWNIDLIKQEAKTNYSPEDIKDAWEVIDFPKELEKYLIKQKEEEKVTEQVEHQGDYDFSTIPFDRKPQDMPMSIFVLSQGGFGAGERHNAILHLATYFKNKGYTDEEIHSECKKAAILQGKRMGTTPFHKKEIWQIVKSLSNWQGGEYNDANSELLAKIANFIPTNIKISAFKDLKEISEVALEAKKFAKEIDKNRVRCGIKEIDEALDFLVGRVYVLAGSPGSGKSSLLLQIFEGLSAQGLRAIYFSFDMSLNDNFQKLVQKEFNLTAKEYFKQAEDDDRFEEFTKKIAEKYKNIIFVDSSGMSIDQMRKRIEYYESTHGEIKVVAVDYMALVQSEKSDSNEHSKAVIQGLKAIATEMKKCVISLNQPNKANQRINESLNGYGGIAGSAELQNLANVICWVFRPGAAPDTFENDKFYCIDILKNRHGPLGTVELRWFGISGTLRSLTPVEQMDLKKLREDLKQKKKENDDF